MMRTNLKQQLMRDQLQQLEAKEKRKKLQTVEAQPTSAVDVPVQSCASIPHQVVTFQSKLSNPTNYHVEHSQKRQVHEFLSQSHFTRNTGCLPQHVVRVANSYNYSDNDVASTANTSASGRTSANETYNNFFDDFDDITSSVADSGVVEHGFPVSIDTFSGENLTLLTMLSTKNIESSSTCTEEYESYNEKSPASDKERSKKNAHNEVEKRRRDKINNFIKQLKAELPESSDLFFDNGKDKVKGAVLQESVTYIKSLKVQVKKIPELEKALRTERMKVQKLLASLQNYESVLKLHNIPVSESIWHPLSESDIKALIKREPNFMNDITCSSSGPQISSKSVTQFNNTKLMEKSLQNSNHCSRPGRPTLQFLTVQSAESNSAPNDFLSSDNATYLGCFNSSNLDFFENNHVITQDVMFQARESSTPEDMDILP